MSKMTRSSGKWEPRCSKSHLFIQTNLVQNKPPRPKDSGESLYCVVLCLLIKERKNKEKKGECLVLNVAPTHHQPWTQMLELDILNSLVVSAPTSLASQTPGSPIFSSLPFLVPIRTYTFPSHFTSNCDLGVGFWVLKIYYWGFLWIHLCDCWRKWFLRLNGLFDYLWILWKIDWHLQLSLEFICSN